MERAVLGFAAFLASGSALSHSNHDTAQNHDSTPNSYALLISDEARLHFNPDYLEKLPQLAKTQVLLLTDGDISNMTNSQFKFDIPLSIQNAFPDFPIQSARSETIIEMAKEISEGGSPSAYGFKANPESPHNTHCVIVMNQVPLSAEDIFKQISSYEGDIHNLQSTAEDFHLYVLTHEASHCLDDYEALAEITIEEQFQTKLQYEFKADAFSFHFHGMDEENNPFWQENHVREEVHAARVLGAFSMADLSYSFTGSIESNLTQKGGEHLKDFTSFVDSFDSAETFEAHSAIWQALLEKRNDFNTRVMEPLQFLYASLAYQNEEESASSAEGMKLLSSTEVIALRIDELGQVAQSNSLPPEEKTELEELLVSTRERLSNSGNPFERMLVTLAPIYQKESFTLQETYQLVKQVKQDETFSLPPLARKEMDLFIHAYEKYIAPGITDTRKPQTQVASM